MQSASRLVCGVIFNRKKDKDIYLVSSLFLTHICVYVCVHTHKHCTPAHRVLDVSPGAGTGHLEGPKNLDRLNLGICIHIYVQSSHV